MSPASRWSLRFGISEPGRRVFLNTSDARGPSPSERRCGACGLFITVCWNLFWQSPNMCTTSPSNTWNPWVTGHSPVLGSSSLNLKRRVSPTDTCVRGRGQARVRTETHRCSNRYTPLQCRSPTALLGPGQYDTSYRRNRLVAVGWTSKTIHYSWPMIQQRTKQTLDRHQSTI